MSTIPNPSKSRTWDLGTSANGTFFDTEFNQLYANDNDLDGRLETVEANYVSAVPRASWRADTMSGLGSSATKIPYFANVNENVDTAGAMTVVNNSTDGCKATINVAGRYAITFWGGGNYSDYIGISVNGTPTTNVTSLAAGLVRSLVYGSGGGATDTICTSWVGYLSVNDVVRPHTNAGSGASNNRSGFSIERIA